MSTCVRRRWFISLHLAAAFIALTPIAEAASWTEVSGGAREIAAGDGTSPWVVGTTENGTGNYDVYYWNPNTTSWVSTDLAVAKIALEYGQFVEGETYYVNAPVGITYGGDIFFGIPGGQDIGSSSGGGVTATSAGTGCATSISAAGEPAIPVVTGCTEDGSGDYEPFKSTDHNVMDSWASLSTATYGTRIAVSQDGYDIWMIQANHDIFRYDAANSSFNQTSGGAIDISGGGSCSYSSGYGSCTYPPYLVGTDNYLYNFTSGSWSRVTSWTGAAAKVSVGMDGTVWVVDTSAHIWYSCLGSTCP